MPVSDDEIQKISDARNNHPGDVKAIEISSASAVASETSEHKQINKISKQIGSMHIGSLSPSIRTELSHEQSSLK